MAYKNIRRVLKHKTYNFFPHIIYMNYAIWKSFFNKSKFLLFSLDSGKFIFYRDTPF